MVYLRFTYDYLGVLIPHITGGIHIAPYDGTLNILNVYLKRRGTVIECYNFKYKMTMIDDETLL